MNTVETGIVKSFERGCGFIEREGKKDLFVHQTNIVMDKFRTLQKGQKVTFKEGDGLNGKKQALEVTPVKD